VPRSARNSRSWRPARLEDVCGTKITDWSSRAEASPAPWSRISKCQSPTDRAARGSAVLEPVEVVGQRGGEFGDTPSKLPAQEI